MLRTLNCVLFLEVFAINKIKTKDALVNNKEKSENDYNSDSNVNDYASNKVGVASNMPSDEIVTKFNSSGKKTVITIKDNI